MPKLIVSMSEVVDTSARSPQHPRPPARPRGGAAVSFPMGCET